MSFNAVLVVATHGIGDVILTSQVLLKLPSNIKLSILVTGQAEKQVVQYLFKDKNVDCFAIKDFGKDKVVQFIKSILYIRTSKFDFAFAQYGVSSPLYALLAYLGGVKYRVGWSGRFSFLNHNSLTYSGKHKVLDTATILSYFGVGWDQADFEWETVLKSSGHSEKKLIVIGPNSFDQEAHKRWPYEKYAELCRKLISKYDVVVEIFGSPEERVYSDKIIELVGSPKIKNSCGKYTMGESLDRIGLSQLVIANCNAISHMGAAMGIHVVGIYGPTDYELTAPFTSHLSIVTNNLECSPCYRRGYTSGCGNPICMSDISVDSVLVEVGRNLAN